MKAEKVDFTKRILKEEGLLNDFLNSIGYNYDSVKHKFILSKKGIYVFCDKEENSLSDVFNMMGGVFKNFLSMSFSGYDSREAIVLVNDMQCIASNEDLELANDKSAEWLEFLAQTFGYEFVNKHKQMVKEQNKKDQQKNENSRTF